MRFSKEFWGWIGVALAFLGTFSLAMNWITFGFLVRISGDLAWLANSVSKPISKSFLANTLMFLAVDLFGLWRNL